MSQDRNIPIVCADDLADLSFYFSTVMISCAIVIRILFCSRITTDGFIYLESMINMNDPTQSSNTCGFSEVRDVQG